MHQLSSYPHLNKWYQKRKASPPPISNGIVEYTNWHFCQAFANINFEETYFIWIRTLNKLLSYSVDPQSDYEKIESFFNKSGYPLSQQISNLGHQAFQLQKDDEFFHLMCQAAKKIKLDSFHFMAAWTALNRDDYSACIDECTKILAPSASVNTLHGQALLESGEPENASIVLEEATELDPNEVLAWFQLAKSEWVQSKLEGAWEALKICHSLVPNNIEVALFFSIIAIEKRTDSSWLKFAWNVLHPYLLSFPNNRELIVKLCSLAFTGSEKNWATFVVSNSKWDEVYQAMIADKELGNILRSLGELEWFDLANKILLDINI